MQVRTYEEFHFCSTKFYATLCTAWHGLYTCNLLPTLLKWEVVLTRIYAIVVVRVTKMRFTCSKSVRHFTTVWRSLPSNTRNESAPPYTVCDQPWDGDQLSVPWCVWAGCRSAWNDSEPVCFSTAALPHQWEGEYVSPASPQSFYEMYRQWLCMEFSCSTAPHVRLWELLVAYTSIQTHLLNLFNPGTML